jgi:hypothetical protein
MTALGMILTLLGATALYAAGEHQQLQVRNTGRPGLIAGVLLLVGGLLTLLQGFGPATAVFVWATEGMLAWSIVPIAVAWWRGAPDHRR